MGNRHGLVVELAPIRVCTHSVGGTEGHHGGQRGSRQQPALRCRSTSRRTAVLIRDVRGVRDARGARGVRGALDGLWNRELRQAGVEPIGVGVNDVVPRRDVGRSETIYVSRQKVEVVEGLRCDGAVSRDSWDAMRTQMEQCRRQTGDPTKSRKNCRWMWASIQMGFWKSGALLHGRLAPCPILNYGCCWCCSDVSDVFAWWRTNGDDDPTCTWWRWQWQWQHWAGVQQWRGAKTYDGMEWVRRCRRTQPNRTSCSEERLRRGGLVYNEIAFGQDS